MDNFSSFSREAHFIDLPIEVQVLQGIYDIFLKLKKVATESPVHVPRDGRIHFSVQDSGGLGHIEPCYWSAFASSIHMRVGQDHPLEIIQGRIEVPKSFRNRGKILETWELDGGVDSLNEYLDRAVEKGDANILKPKSGEVWFLSRNVIHRIVDTLTTNFTHEFWIPGVRHTQRDKPGVRNSRLVAEN